MSFLQVDLYIVYVIKSANLQEGHTFIRLRHLNFQRLVFPCFHGSRDMAERLLNRH